MDVIRNDERAPEPAFTCDISTMCLNCGEEMRAEHAHMRCDACGWRDSCCDGPY